MGLMGGKKNLSELPTITASTGIKTFLQRKLSSSSGIKLKKTEEKENIWFTKFHLIKMT
jgi:hypothetical protein